MTPERHLWNRGQKGKQDNWYLRLPIPKPLRQHFAKPGGSVPISIIEPLDTDSLSMARRKRDELTVAYRRVFDRLEAGERMSPDEIRAAVSLDLGVITERIRANMLDSFHRATPGDVLLQYGAYGSLKPPPDLFVTIAELAKREGVKIEPETALWDSVATTITRARNAAYAEAILLAFGTPAPPMMTTSAPAPVEPVGETISQAASAWFDEMQNDPSTAVRKMTLDGYRSYVQAFVKQCGDVPLTSVNVAMASDFLAAVSGGRANRTTNKYATTLAGVFKSARKRGRFTGDNPFEGQRRKTKKNSYAKFQVSDLQTLFDSFTFETTPKHSPESAMPWMSLIAAFTGMRLEEIAQLAVRDIRDISANGSTVTVFDIHNGGDNHLKTDDSAVRRVPIHSALVRAGLLDYVEALPKDGLLFPGLTRRASKDNKIGARVGELFGKKLKALGLKREGLVFHSFRHTVGKELEDVGIHQSAVARLLGHAIEEMTFGIYSEKPMDGPGLKRLAAVVEEIAYPGLRIPKAAGKVVATKTHQRLP